MYMIRCWSPTDRTFNLQGHRFSFQKMFWISECNCHLLILALESLRDNWHRTGRWLVLRNGNRGVPCIIMPHSEYAFTSLFIKAHLVVVPSSVQVIQQKYTFILYREEYKDKIYLHSSNIRVMLNLKLNIKQLQMLNPIYQGVVISTQRVETLKKSLITKYLLLVSRNI